MTTTTSSVKTYPNLTDGDITRLRDAISNTVSNISKDIKKERFKSLARLSFLFVLVSGGVVVSIIFPNPITIGVLGGAATLLASGGGIFRKSNKTKEKAKEKTKIKKDIKDLSEEEKNRKLAATVKRIMDNDAMQTEPSAPPPNAIYPSLEKFKKKFCLNKKMDRETTEESLRKNETRAVIIRGTNESLDEIKKLVGLVLFCSFLVYMGALYNEYTLLKKYE